VARLGLPLISQFFEPPETIAEKVRLYRDAAAPDAAGCATVPAIRDVAIGDPGDLAARLLPLYRRYAAWGMPLLGRPTAPEEIGPAEVARIALLGSADHVAERLVELREAGATDILARADLPGIPRRTCEGTIAALGAIRSTLQS
jgi:alkanesulfonate monooxygenase SsuD/methylene tetrahydromethanopterin reductase-like flavin-dependent oxidoreductase (luciferase family)